MFNVGDKVLASIGGGDYMPATIVSTEGWFFVSSLEYAVEFDRHPVTTSGTLSHRRVTVNRGKVRAIN